MVEHRYAVVIRPLADEDGGGYVAVAPDLKGCTGDGATPEEALADLQSAILEWIDEATRLGREIPAPGQAAILVNSERKISQDLISAQRDLIKHQDSLLSQQDQLLRQAKEKIKEMSDKAFEISVRKEAVGTEYASWDLLVPSVSGSLIETEKGKVYPH